MGFLKDIDNLQQQADGVVAPPPDAAAHPGRLGTATIDAVRETGETAADGTPLTEYDLTVTVDGGTPYAVTHRQAIGLTILSSLRPGATVPVRVDPADRSSLTIG